METRTIAAPPGIGDAIFMLFKLWSLDQKFHWLLPAAKPQRGHQVFELLPQVTESCKYDEGISTRQILMGNAQECYGNRWEVLKEHSHMFLSANNWLDEGNRIEGWLPDLPMTYHLPWQTTYQDQLDADELKNDVRHTIWLKHCIGIYPSAYKNNLNWSNWSEYHWFDLIKRFNKAKPGMCYVLLGAEYDRDLINKMIPLLEEENISYCNTVGMLLGAVIEILKRLHAFIGFPSGLSIINETLPGTITRMFYPESLRPMIPAWADKKRIDSGEYEGMVFGTPKEAFEYFSPGII